MVYRGMDIKLDVSTADREALLAIIAEQQAMIDEILDKHNVTIEQIRDYVAKHPKYRNAMRRYPHHHGISQAANFIAEIAPRVK